MAEPSTTDRRTRARPARNHLRPGRRESCRQRQGLRPGAEHGTAASAHARNHRVRHQGGVRHTIGPAAASSSSARRRCPTSRWSTSPSRRWRSWSPRPASRRTSASRDTAAPRCTSASSRAPIRSGTPAGSAEPFRSTYRRRGMRCAAASPTSGYVVVERGVEADVTAIACPVYSEARIVAALSLVVPSYRLTAAGGSPIRPDARLGRGGRCPPD